MPDGRPITRRQDYRPKHHIVNHDVRALSYLSLYVEPAANTSGAPWTAVAPLPAIVIEVICFVVEINTSCRSVADPGAISVIVPEAREVEGFSINH